jgi:hypothetical protein
MAHSYLLALNLFHVSNNPLDVIDAPTDKYMIEHLVFGALVGWSSFAVSIE